MYLLRRLPFSLPVYGRILFPVHVVINAESDLAAAPLLSVLFHDFFVFLFFHVVLLSV